MGVRKDRGIAVRVDIRGGRRHNLMLDASLSETTSDVNRVGGFKPISSC